MERPVGARPAIIRLKATDCTRLSQLSIRGDRLATTMSVSSFSAVEQRADAFGLHLEIGGQSQDDVAAAPLDAQPQRGGLAEGPGEAEQPDVLPLLAQGQQLGRRGEPPVEDEDELVLLALGVELRGEGPVERRRGRRPARPPAPLRRRIWRRRRCWRVTARESAPSAHPAPCQRTSQAVGISFALSRSALSATSATRPSINR